MHPIWLHSCVPARCSSTASSSNDPTKRLSPKPPRTSSSTRLDDCSAGRSVGKRPAVARQPPPSRPYHSALGATLAIPAATIAGSRVGTAPEHENPGTIIPITEKPVPFCRQLRAPSELAGLRSKLLFVAQFVDGNGPGTPPTATLTTTF